MRKTPEALAQWEPAIFFKTISFQNVPASVFRHVIAGGELEHRRLRDGGSEIDLLQCRLPNSVICQGAYEPAVLVNGTLPRNAVTVGTMLFQRKASIVNGSKVRSGTVQFCSEGSEICYRAWPGASWIALVISRESLLKFCVDYLEDVPELPTTGIVTIDPQTAKAGARLFDHLRHLGNSLRSLEPGNAERLGELMENDILARVVQFIGAKPRVTQRSDRRLHVCCNVLAHTSGPMNRTLDQMLDLKEMFKATGLSIRTIQRAFQAEVGLSSVEWMRVERLHRVRDDLLDENRRTTVMEAATRQGFSHLGRFSKYYRDLFGESPSVTISRRAMIQNNVKHMSSRFERRNSATQFHDDLSHFG